MSGRRIAAFDFDGTLTRRDTLVPFLAKACGTQALTRALDGFTRASRSGQIPAALRARLVKASGQVAVQRESLLRATVALDGALEALLPREDAVVYGRLDSRSSALFTH